MRKIYLLAGLLFAFSAQSQVLISDDFESYPVGSYFGGHWSNWSGATGAENIIVSQDRAVSGTKSGYISNDGIQDAILQFGDEFYEGEFNLQMKMYVPSAGGAYTNIQEKAEIGAGNFANVFTFGYTPTQIPTSTPGEAHATGTEGYYSFEYPTDEWFTFNVKVSLDELYVTPTVNGEFIEDGAPVDVSLVKIPYGGDYFSIAAFDLFSYVSGAANSTWYIDDVVFAKGELAGVKDANVSEYKIYPTVVSNQVFTVSGKDKINNLEVYNMAGQQVLKLAPNATSVQVNASKLTAGTYVVKIVGEKNILSKKVIVK